MIQGVEYVEEIFYYLLLRSVHCIRTVALVPNAAAAVVSCSTLISSCILLLLLITNDEYSSKMLISNCDNKVCLFNNCLLGLFVCMLCVCVWCVVSCDELNFDVVLLVYT